MEYIKFRIDTQAIRGHKVVNGWFVRGQSAANYNWPLLYQASSLDDAKEFILRIRGNGQTVYGPDGYEIKF